MVRDLRLLHYTEKRTLCSVWVRLLVIWSPLSIPYDGMEIIPDTDTRVWGRCPRSFCRRPRTNSEPQKSPSHSEEGFSSHRMSWTLTQTKCRDCSSAPIRALLLLTLCFVHLLRHSSIHLQALLSSLLSRSLCAHVMAAVRDDVCSRGETRSNCTADM